MQSFLFVRHPCTELNQVEDTFLYFSLSKPKEKRERPFTLGLSQKFRGMIKKILDSRMKLSMGMGQTRD